jgi:hypothetical protein
MQLWQIWPRREAAAKGRNCVNRTKCPYFFHTCTRVVVGIVTYVRRLQWEQSRMYAGCGRHSRVYMGCSEAQSRMYMG